MGMKNRRPAAFYRRPMKLFFICATLASAQDVFQTFNSMQDLDAFWTKSSWGGSNRTHSPDNIRVQNGILELELSGSTPGSLPVCAEIVSRRSDFHYGTYRSLIKITNKPGAVVGWFTYNGNPLNEIDIEFLTEDHKRAYFTLHHIQTNVDHANKLLTFDPSLAFHEYRFDWYATKVDYYVDGQLLATLTQNVPDTQSRLLLNHWSGNIAGWGGPAPTEDVFMHVDWAYYSSTYKPPVLTPITPKRPNRGMAIFPVENGLFRGNTLLVVKDGKRFSLTGKSTP